MATDHTGAAAVEWPIRLGMQVAQIAFSTYAANRQFKLAEEYSNRANEIHVQQLALLTDDVRRWYDKASGGLDNMLDEAIGAPPVVTNFSGEIGQTLAFVRMNSGLAQKAIYEGASLTCVGMTKHDLKELKYKEAALATSAVNMAMRREELDVERKEAIRRDYRSQAIAISRNAYDGSSRSASVAAASYGNLAAAAGQGLSSSLQAIGYGAQGIADQVFDRNRNEPARTTIDNTRANTASPYEDYNLQQTVHPTMVKTQSVNELIGANNRSAIQTGTSNAFTGDGGEDGSDSKQSLRVEL